MSDPYLQISIMSLNFNSMTANESLQQLRSRARFLRDRLIFEYTINYNQDKFFQLCASSDEKEEFIRFTIILNKSKEEANELNRSKILVNIEPAPKFYYIKIRDIILNLDV